MGKTKSAGWRVFSNPINGKNMFIVGRVIDPSKPVHSGNVEYHGEYVESRFDAYETAMALNEEAKNG
jgi:hypothetical protein